MSDLIDIGANLTHESFVKDFDAVLERAHAAGVQRIIVTGTSAAASQAAATLAANSSGMLYATAGVHPHHADDYIAATTATLRAIAGSPEVIALGECGLDYFRNFSEPAAQRYAFRQQLLLAADIGLPVFLHQRDAHNDFVKILREHIGSLAGGVAHCFTGTLEQMSTYLDMGLYIGITGWICDERRGHDLRDAVRELPLDRVLIETDAPYLLPRTLPQKPFKRRNEPSVLPHVLETLADLMQVDSVALAKHATENTERLFRLPSHS